MYLFPTVKILANVLLIKYWTQSPLVILILINKFSEEYQSQNINKFIHTQPTLIPIHSSLEICLQIIGWHFIYLLNNNNNEKRPTGSEFSVHSHRTYDQWFSLHHSASSEGQYTYYNSMVVCGDQKKLPESCRLLVLVAKTKDKRSK